MRDDAGRDDGQADEQAKPSWTAGGAAWRFAPLALIACSARALPGRWAGIAISSLAWLADSRDVLRAHVDANYLLSALVFVVLLRAGDGAFLSRRCHPDDLRRLPVRLAAGRRSSPCSAPPTGASMLFLAARTAFGGFLRDRVRRLCRETFRTASRRTPSPICWCCGLPRSFRSSWSTSRRRCAACGRRSSWRRPSSASCPARSPIPGWDEGSTACCWRPRRPAATLRSMIW